MNNRGQELIDRLKAVAEILHKDPTELVSIKLQPLMPSTDKANLGNFSTAYQYPSEYKAGLAKVKYSKPDDEVLRRIMRTVRNPMGDKVIFVINDANSNDIFWIQHETGLEIIGGISDILAIVFTLFEIYNAIHDKIKENRTNETSDRYYKEVKKTVVTTRTFNKSGKLKEKVVEETEITKHIKALTADEFAKLLGDSD